MSDIPDTLVLKRHRDLDGKKVHLGARRVILALITLFLVLGLANVFGQRPVTATATASAADLKLYAPNHLRGGLLYTARFHITAHRDLKKATLVLDPGWAEGMSINTIEPSPVNEASRDGKLALDLGHLAAGARYVLYVDYQVNPTTIGSRTLRAELDDGERPIASITRNLRIWP